MFYVYILRSEKDGSLYHGFTSDLKRRIIEHDRRGTITTRKNRPWKLLWYCAFISRKKAEKFERYLKTGSGSAFRNRHLA